MGRSIDFIGLGAQRSATSWIYACLYEHPQICVPVKEVHFFSRERNWSKGSGWYEGIFDDCPVHARVGEYSTSYLSDENTPLRIYESYPQAKLLVCLRNPVDRAYSSYMNDIMAGKVDVRQPFAEALAEHPEYLQQGCYASQLQRYLGYFARDQILVMVYEDALKDPRGFIAAIFRFLEVDSSFIPSMVHRRVNEGRVPRVLVVDKLLRKMSDVFLALGLHGIWWSLKRAGVGNKIRSLNTVVTALPESRLAHSTRASVYALLQDEIRGVQKILDRDLRDWHI